MLERRRVLIGGGALAVGAAAATALGIKDMGSIEDYSATVAESRSALKQSPEILDFVRYATLAANSHNTQPWRFRIAEKQIEIRPDMSRRLPVVRCWCDSTIYSRTVSRRLRRVQCCDMAAADRRHWFGIGRRRSALATLAAFYETDPDDPGADVGRQWDSLSLYLLFNDQPGRQVLCRIICTSSRFVHSCCRDSNGLPLQYRTRLEVCRRWFRHCLRNADLSRPGENSWSWIDGRANVWRRALPDDDFHNWLVDARARAVGKMAFDHSSALVGRRARSNIAARDT